MLDHVDSSQCRYTWRAVKAKYSQRLPARHAFALLYDCCGQTGNLDYVLLHCGMLYAWLPVYQLYCTILQ